MAVFYVYKCKACGEECSFDSPTLRNYACASCHKDNTLVNTGRTKNI